MKQEKLNSIKNQLSGNITTDLTLLQSLFGNKIVFSTSFSMEDQLITYFIAQMQNPVQIFTLDTGRLFSETYNVWESTRKKYNLPIQAYFPDKIAVEKMVTDKGIYSFYESVENRKECCFIRKVAPLKRALKGNQIWVTGLRSEQSQNRTKMNVLEWDETNQIIKYQPILSYPWRKILKQIHTFGIPYNALHEKGFLSIGCQPCTRAIQQGENARAGRWWWENSKKECGLHSITNKEELNERK